MTSSPIPSKTAWGKLLQQALNFHFAAITFPDGSLKKFTEYNIEGTQGHRSKENHFRFAVSFSTDLRQKVLSKTEGMENLGGLNTF